MSGTVKDKATALKHSVAGSSVNKIVCKATSHDIAGPKKKHVDFLLSLTNNPQGNPGSISDMLIERLHNTNWVVVFKALITSHTLMNLGNEKYLQTLASKTNPFDIESFTDRTTIQATEMTPYIHRYSRYLGSLCANYRAVAIDFLRMNKGEGSPFRSMETAKLLKCTVLIQGSLDKLVDFEVTRGELNNGVINTAFTMLYQDLTKLYAAYNDALINILEHFFEMKKSQCKEAVECYRKFIIRQQSITKFLQLAEDVGIDRKKHLNLRQVPEDLLPALEQHLEEMDAIRKAANVKQPSPQIQAASAKLTELKSKSPSGSGKSSPIPSSGVMPSANEETLSAQRKRFEDLKKRASDKTLKVEGAPTTASISKESSPNPEEDEFTAMATTRSTPQLQQKKSGMDDLIGLGLESQWTTGVTSSSASNSPWATPTLPTANTNNNPFTTGGAASTGGNPWGGSGGYQEIGLFNSQPPPSSTTSNNGLGDILMPLSSGPYASQQTPPQTQKLTTDVDSSLAMAASNLSLELGGNKGTGMGTGMAMKKSGHQWGPDPTQKNTLTGGANYQGQRQLQPTTLPPMQMGGTPTAGGQPANWSTGMQGGYFPATQPQMNNPFGTQQPMGGGYNPGGMGMNPSMGMGGNMFGGGFPAQQTQFPQTQFNNPQPSLF